MGPRRIFLDWSEPALAGAVDRLCATRSEDGFVDLSNVIAVTSGGRANRRFLELLAEKTEGRNAAPVMATPGDLPERLYELKRPLADDLTQQLAWVEALRGQPDERLRRIIGTPPADGDMAGWLSLGQLLARVHRELAADSRDFRDVAKLPAIDAARERPRWEALAEVQGAYHRLLDDLGLWDRQTARLVAVRENEARTDCDLVLIGLVDMNRTLRELLHQVADRVQVFVHAPRSESDRFDEFGVLRVAAWEGARIDLHEDWLRFVDQPQDQADSVVEFVSRQAREGRSADDVVIGLADDSLASAVRTALEDRKVATRWIGRRSVGDTAACRLLEAIADRLESDATAVTCSLIRHPVVGRWIDAQAVPRDWLRLVDEAVIEHAPRRLGGGRGQDAALATSRAIAELVEKLLSPLTGAHRPIGDWAEQVNSVLARLYQGVEFDLAVESQRFEDEALAALAESLRTLANVPESLSPSGSASAAIRLAIEQVSGSLLTPDSRTGAVEMVGWLELALDDAPALVVCGVNEGFVPSSLNHDMLLPNGLREQLELEDNRRRYCRDAYALTVLAQSRKDLRLISGRRNASGDPLQPSRLIFACDVPTIAHRVLQACCPAGDDQRREAPVRAVGRLSIPRPIVRRPPGEVSVTAFRDYIACPYRFYLRHVERLEVIEELDGELTGATFGNLIHDALSEWAESPVVDATSPSEISGFLREAFDRGAAKSFDAEPLPAVKLQLEQAHLRLERFARWQAERRRQGWQVRFNEVNANCALPLASRRALRVRGRIDRIDYHPATDCWAVIDYKTGDAGDSPKRVHYSGGKWVDLQLPLYRRLAESLDIHGRIELAYVTLGRDSATEIYQLADWSDTELAEADAEVLRIADHIAEGLFWPPANDPPVYDDFPRLLQEGVFGREVEV